MGKISDNGTIRDMTAEEQAEYDARQVEFNSDERKLKHIKKMRLRRLQETDWWVLRGEMTDEQKVWRQSLRDIPTTFSSSDYDSLLARETDETKDNYMKLTHEIWSKP
jgi:hypothetical protein